MMLALSKCPLKSSELIENRQVLADILAFAREKSEKQYLLFHEVCRYRRLAQQICHIYDKKSIQLGDEYISYRLLLYT